MSQIMKITVPAMLLGMVLFLVAGCGDSNSKSPFDADSGHPSNWVYAGHADAAKTNAEGCTECHGSDLSGGISKVACSSCHTNGSPYELKGCTSCHGNPPSGIVAPNRAGAHNTSTGHFAANITLPDSCNTCHSGAGSGTAKHDSGNVDVAFLNAYNAKSGAAIYNADGTCSKVSCHGGQTTPNWLTGSLDVFSQCKSCHAYGTSEYNSFVSGQHDFHVNVAGYGCVACHDSAKLTVSHFVTLNTSSMEGPASATIRTDFVHYDSVAHTCTADCHTPPSAVRAW